MWSLHSMAHRFWIFAIGHERQGTHSERNLSIDFVVGLVIHRLAHSQAEEVWNGRSPHVCDNAGNHEFQPQRSRETSRRHDCVRPLEFKKARRAVFVYSWAFGVPIVPKFWGTKLDVVRTALKYFVGRSLCP